MRRGEEDGFSGKKQKTMMKKIHRRMNEIK